MAKDWSPPVRLLPLGQVFAQTLCGPGHGQGTCVRVFALRRIRAGKSAILEAIPLALYGNCTRWKCW